MNRWRSTPSGTAASPAAVVAPSPPSFDAHRRPTPHTSPTAIDASHASRSGCPHRHTHGSPPAASRAFAHSDAALAKVFVSAQLTRTGMPVHRSTRTRISAARRSISAHTDPGSPGGVGTDRNASSMLYTSTSGVNVSRHAITRRLMSP